MQVMNTVGHLESVTQLLQSGVKHPICRVGMARQSSPDVVLLQSLLRYSRRTSLYWSERM